MDRTPSSRRVGQVAAAVAFVLLVAFLAWRAWEQQRKLEAVMAAPVAAPAPRAAPPQPPPSMAEPPDLPYGRWVRNTTAPQAPALDLPTADGSRFSLAQARGQVVFLNFWATWCPPCAKEMPTMVRLGQELARAHPGKFRMVAVSVDTSFDLVKAFFKQPAQGGRLPKDVTVVLDPEAARVTRAYYCAGRGACGPDDVKFPESYVVDRQGRITAFVIGDRDWSEPDARALLEELIKG